MSNDTASKVPPVVIRTCEFDCHLYMAREAQKLYEKNGTLLEYGMYGGSWHGHHYYYDLHQTD